MRVNTAAEAKQQDEITSRLESRHMKIPFGETVVILEHLDFSFRRS